MNQLTFDGTVNLKIVSATFSDSKRLPFIKGNHWQGSSFRRGRSGWRNRENTALMFPRVG